MTAPNTYSSFRAAIVTIAIAGLGACTNGGSDDSDDLSPTKNACSVLGLSTRIIDGAVCSDTNSPIVKLTIVTTGGQEGLCSGAMISARSVLTAAHCFLTAPTASVTVRSGSASSQATEVTVHPDAEIVGSGDSVQVVNDVAVVTLRNSLGTPTLPLLGFGEIEEGDIFSIFGYGLDENGNLGTLRSGQSEVSNVTTQHILASYDGETGSNSCNGDSGGPAILTLEYNGRERDAIVGVVSSGSNEACTAGDLSLYANLTSPELFQFVRDQVPDVELVIAQ